MVTHENECLVKFKGHGAEENEWLPGSTFLAVLLFKQSHGQKEDGNVTSHEIEGKTFKACILKPL